MVVSRAQEWESVPLIRVPLGAIAPVPYMMAHAERDDRTVTGLPGNPEVAALVSGESTLAPGETAWLLRAEGVNVGATTVTLASPGPPFPRGADRGRTADGGDP